MTGRGLRGRRVARALLIAAISIDVVFVLMLLSQPVFIGPMSFEPPPLVWWLVPMIGIAMNLVGLAWMIRIFRSDPEAHAPHWRFDRS